MKYESPSSTSLTISMGEVTCIVRNLSHLRADCKAESYKDLTALFNPMVELWIGDCIADLQRRAAIQALKLVHSKHRGVYRKEAQICCLPRICEMYKLEHVTKQNLGQGRLQISVSDPTFTMVYVTFME